MTAAEEIEQRLGERRGRPSEEKCHGGDELKGRTDDEDKRRAVMTLLQDAEWGGWSDREIARRCGVDHKTVAPLRASITGENPQSARTYTTKHGTTATMSTANIGRQARHGGSQARNHETWRQSAHQRTCKFACPARGRGKVAKRIAAYRCHRRLSPTSCQGARHSGEASAR